MQPLEKDNKSTITSIKLEAYKMILPVSKLDARGVYTWGVDNAYPDYLISLLDKSAKHSAIINSKVKFLVGEGVIVNGPIDVENNISKVDNWFDQITKVGKDLEVFDGFALEKTKNASGGFGEINYIPLSKLRYDKKGNIWYSKDWTSFKCERKIMVKYNPIYDEGVMIYQMYNQSNSHYPKPSYSACIGYIETDWAIQKYRLNNIKNGFSSGTLLSFNSGVPLADEQDHIKKEFKKRHQGEDNAGEVVITFSVNADQSPTIQSLSPNGLDTMWKDVDQSVQDNIFIGHSVTSPQLMGVLIPGLLGGRTDLADAADMFQSHYVTSRQRALESAYNYLLEPQNTKIQIVPLPGVKTKFSEAALMTILTKDELRAMAGYKPLTSIQEATVAPTQMNATESILKRFEELGSTDDEVVKLGFRIHDGTDAEYKENLLKVMKFSTLSELDKSVLELLNENKKLSIKDLASTLEVETKEIEASVKNLAVENMITGEVGVEIKIGKEGTDELKTIVAETETKYKYATRTDVPRAKSGSRDFCVRMMEMSDSGKLYTRAEIESVSNEFGESAWLHRGGWYRNPSTDRSTNSCRHEWRQVVVTKK